MAVHHPVGQHLAGTAGGLDADGVEPSSHKKVAHLRGFAQQVAVVGSEALRPIEEQVDAHVRQPWGTVHGGRQQRLDVLQIVGQLVEAEGLGDAAHAPGLGHRLEPAHQQLACVFLEVGASVRVAQHRHAGRQARHRFGHYIKVFCRVQRNGGAGAGAEFMCPHSGAIDDHVGAQLALGRTYPDGAAVVDQDLLDPGVLEDLRAAALGALGQRLRGVDRIGAAVLRQVDTPDQVASVYTRPQAGDFGGRERLHLQAEAAGHGGAALEFLEACRVGGNRDRAGLAKTGGLAGFHFQPGIQAGGVLRQPCHVVGGAQLADQPGGMPGGAAGELLAFEQHHIGPAPQREVVGHAATYDAPADDDNLGTTWQIHGITCLCKNQKKLYCCAIFKIKFHT